MPAQVSGANRFRHFRRALLAVPEVIVKQGAAPPPPVLLPYIEPPKAKTIGTQSDYRESEAQTVPWEPEAVLPDESTARQVGRSQREGVGALAASCCVVLGGTCLLHIKGHKV